MTTRKTGLPGCTAAGTRRGIELKVLRLFSGPQYRLRLVARSREESCRKFDGIKCLATLDVSIRDIVKVDITAIKTLKDEENIFSVCAPDRIAVTTYVVNRVENFLLSGFAVIQVEITKAVITDGVIQQEEMVAIPIEAGNLIGAFRIGETEIQAGEFIHPGRAGIGTVLKIHKQQRDLIAIGQFGIHNACSQEFTIV